MNPDIFTISEHFVEVGDGHQLYVQDWGNKQAKTPIIFLHGGPGAGLKDRHKQRFIGEKQRLIFIDQRGAGKSLPKGSLVHNTSDALVEDIEKIVDYLKIDKFYITGGSWGSCLALQYGIKYPKRVLGMVLSGIFTGRQSEIDYLDDGGFRLFFPDVWDRYLAKTPKQYHSDPSAYHYKRAFGTDKTASKESAYAYAELEGPLLALDDRYVPENFAEFDPDGTRIEMHFLANKCFIPNGFIQKNATKLTMPIWLVQGRYDTVCPPMTAYELDKLLPSSTLIFTIAGHGNDRPNYEVIRTLLLQLAVN